MPNTTEDFFQVYAKDFDAIYGNKHSWFNALVNKYFRESMRTRFAKSLTALQPLENKTVLDVGCGPGHYCLALANMGAKHVTGIDFAPEMIRLAKEKAASGNVANKCEFFVADFHGLDEAIRYDYTVLMGFMDYMEDPLKTINKTIEITNNRAVFSFPNSKGFLAWQRRLRYKKRCPLYLYSISSLHELFGQISGITYCIEPIQRDYFVTVDIV